MKKTYKLISMLLAVLMLLGSMSALFTVNVFAADDTNAIETETGTESGEVVEIPNSKTQEDIDYINQLFATPAEKIATMRLALSKDGFNLYVDDYTGEVACVNMVTGEYIFTNPYDVAASTGNETTKYEVLSQIIVHFTDQQGQDKHFNSFEEAYKRGQIVTEPIKNGLRVEYTIGREQTKTLVPRLISKERFDDIIMGAALEAFGEDLYSDDPTPEVFKFQKFLTYYVLYSKEKLDIDAAERKKISNIFGGVYDGLIESDRSLTAVLSDYPIVDTMPVYVFDPTASESEIAMCEELILTYCPDYTYEELDYDHALTEYESEDENPPVFRMALEYKIDEKGITVRLPANGIRFNESMYTLSSIDVLPYMGAGNGGYEGYNFFPDGSGTLFDFQELNTNTTRSVMGKVYGTDFAYNEISGTYQKVIRYPVFGIVEETSYYNYSTTDIDTGEITSSTNVAGAIVEAIRAFNAGEEPKAFKGKEGSLITAYGTLINNMNATETYFTEKHGFLAIIEEGDALASLATYHAGSLNDYNTIKMSFTPRPKDTYNLKDSISVASNSEWTVVSKRKYVGGYTMRYVLLSDAEKAASVGLECYDASWLGMAIAYRDYLTEKGIISKIDPNTLLEDIPLYIETFGTVETIEKILSIPVSVMAPLTSFEDVLTMYNQLSQDVVDSEGKVVYEGITNINFKLTGYANGGMYYSVPGKLKFEKSVGGEEGFQKLLDEAAKINAADKNNNLGIFPDFDFVYQIADEWFNGYQASDHAARMIDDRYASRKEYMPTQQRYENYYELVISPAYFSVFYEMLKGNYVDYYKNVYGISVGTLGTGLHSDFDEDEPYNREDSKDFTIKAFQYMDENYAEVMTSGGNSYSWKYVDHILDVALDSSRYNFSANAVPFIGVVLHGSVSFAGEPLNMEGDLQYALLKAIENGASPYFILSMRNTQVLKEYFDLSQYYSIRYDIWNQDIAEIYDTLNGALHDVQDKYIVNHEFIFGERVPDTDELEADIYNEYITDLEAERNAAEILAKEIALAASIARAHGREAEAYAAEAVFNALSQYEYQLSVANSTIMFDLNYYQRAVDAYREFEKVREYSAYKSSKDADEMKLYAQYTRGNTLLTAVTNFNLDITKVAKLYDANMQKIADIEKDIETARVAYMKKIVAASLAELISEADAKTKANAIVNKIVGDATGNPADDVKKEIIKEQAPASKMAAVLTGTFVDELVATIGEKIAEYTAAEELDVEALTKALDSAIKTKLNKIFTSDVSKDFAAALSATIAKDHVNDNAAALNKLVADTIFAKKENKDAAETKLYDSFVNDLVKAINSVKASVGKDKITELYKTYNNAITSYNTKVANASAKEEDIAKALEAVNAAKAAIDAFDPDLAKLADLFMSSSAANSASKLVISSGFNLSFEDCYKAYYAFEKNSIYSVFMKVATAPNADEEHVNNYASYVDAKLAKEALEAEADRHVITKGNVDNYLIARAQVAVMTELGYDKSDDKTKQDSFNKAKNQLTTTRSSAINAAARIDGENLKALIENYETLVAHLALAEKAIDTLALAENVEVKYAEGKEGKVDGITNYDEICGKSLIVKQAIDRARATFDYLNVENYVAIVDGRESDYTLNGHKLRYTRDTNGNKVYFYGTYEEGYSYFTMSLDENGEPVFEVCHTYLGGDVDSKLGDLTVYNYRQGGKKLYYTATVEDGFKYYTLDSNYNVFVERNATVYNGEKVKTLADGTEVFCDKSFNEPVYYSANEDGTYTRYTYFMSIQDYYDQGIELAKELKAAVAKMGENSGDTSLAEDIQKRIDRLNVSLDVEEEEEVVEEYSRYSTENIVAVTYGNDDGSAYKTIILNYNNYTIRIVYDNIEYTIPAYEFVTIMK